MREISWALKWDGLEER